MAHLRAKYNREGTVNGYAAVFYDPTRHPAEKYVSLRTKDKRIAQRKMTELEKRESLDLFDPWIDVALRPGVLVSEAISEYIKSRQHLRPKTIRSDESTLHLFESSLPVGCLLSQVEPRHIDAFLKHPSIAKRLSASSERTYQTRTATFFKYCQKKGFLRRDPSADRPLPKLPRREKPFLSRQQYDRLLRTIDAHATMIETGMVKQASLKEGEIRWLMDVIEVAVATGFRRTELVNMRWSWVNMDAQHIVVRNTNEFTPKSKHERTVPVRGRALEILQALHLQRTSEVDNYVFTGTGGDQLDATYLSKTFKRFIRLAKLPEDFTFHTLRHTYCSWMIQEGVPVPHVQKLAGHATIETTMQYVHLAPDSLGAAVEKVFG